MMLENIFQQNSKNKNYKSQKLSVSTDDRNDSSKPAQSGIRKFDCFGSTNDLIAFEFNTK